MLQPISKSSHKRKSEPLIRVSTHTMYVTAEAMSRLGDPAYIKMATGEGSLWLAAGDENDYSAKTSGQTGGHLSAQKPSARLGLSKGDTLLMTGRTEEMGGITFHEFALTNDEVSS